MKQYKKLLCVLFAIIFLTAPLGIVAFTPTGSTATLADSAIPAADYDFSNRREPISILVFNQYSDNAGAAEYDHTMGELKAEYGYTFEYDNLTDYTELETRIVDYDVLLLVEQELATYAQMDTVAAAWVGFIAGWVDDGGIVICMDHFSPTDGYHPTARILNNTGLMSIYNSTSRIGQAVTITNSFDPLAFGVSAYTGPSGSSSFDTPDGDAIFSSGGQTVVAHRYFGFGHVVMLGFDMFSIDPNPRTILANAVRLTRLAVFDNSHNQLWDPYGGYNEFSTYIQENFGFAIATMNTWDETIVQTSQILVTGATSPGSLPYDVSEVNFISDFVSSGKGLLIMTDIWWYGNGTDSLLAEFGFERNQTAAYASDSDDHEGQPNQPVFGPENIANHSATISTSSVQMMGPTAFTSIPSDATPLIWTDSDGTAGWSGVGDASGLAVAASLHYGDGRIIAISDGDFLTDTDNDAAPDGIDFFDLSNEQFASSVMIWLSASGIPEKTILFEQSHSPYSSVSSLSTAARLLSFNGFNVRWESQFSEQFIDEADVIVIFNGGSNYTAPEIDVLHDFTGRGGGLFLICDWSTYYEETNEIISLFGLTVNGSSYLTDLDDGWVDPPPSSYIAYEGGNIGAHPIMDGVSRIEIDRGCGFSAIGGSTALVITDDDGTAGWYAGGAADSVPLIVATEYNLGRVVVLADVNFLGTADSDGDNYQLLYDSDNDVFVANAFYWLIENRAPIVDVVFPNGGEILNVTQFVEWTAVDPNRDELTFEVFISDNNGSGWSSLVSGLTGFAYSWNTTLHDDGNSYMIRVVASDGMTTGQDESDDPFTLENFDELPPPGIPFDPTLLAIIGAGVLVVIIILVFVMKKKGGGKK